MGDTTSDGTLNEKENDKENFPEHCFDKVTYYSNLKFFPKTEVNMTRTEATQKETQHNRLNCSKLFFGSFLDLEINPTFNGSQGEELTFLDSTCGKSDENLKNRETSKKVRATKKNDQIEKTWLCEDCKIVHSIGRNVPFGSSSRENKERSLIKLALHDDTDLAAKENYRATDLFKYENIEGNLLDFCSETTETPIQTSDRCYSLDTSTEESKTKEKQLHEKQKDQESPCFQSYSQISFSTRSNGSALKDSKIETTYSEEDNPFIVENSQDLKPRCVHSLTNMQEIVTSNMSTLCSAKENKIPAEISEYQVDVNSILGLENDQSKDWLKQEFVKANKRILSLENDKKQQKEESDKRMERDIAKIAHLESGLNSLRFHLESSERALHLLKQEMEKQKNLSYHNEELSKIELENCNHRIAMLEQEAEAREKENLNLWQEHSQREDFILTVKKELKTSKEKLQGKILEEKHARLEIEALKKENEISKRQMTEDFMRAKLESKQKDEELLNLRKNSSRILSQNLLLSQEVSSKVNLLTQVEHELVLLEGNMKQKDQELSDTKKIVHALEFFLTDAHKYLSIVVITICKYLAPIAEPADQELFRTVSQNWDSGPPATAAFESMKRLFVPAIERTIEAYFRVQIEQVKEQKELEELYRSLKIAFTCFEKSIESKIDEDARPEDE